VCRNLGEKWGWECAAAQRSSRTAQPNEDPSTGMHKTYRDRQVVALVVAKHLASAVIVWLRAGHLCVHQHLQADVQIRQSRIEARARKRDKNESSHRLNTPLASAIQLQSQYPRWVRGCRSARDPIVSRNNPLLQTPQLTVTTRDDVRDSCSRLISEIARRAESRGWDRGVLPHCFRRGNAFFRSKTAEKVERASLALDCRPVPYCEVLSL
jgi:hypothetical protein